MKQKPDDDEGPMPRTPQSVFYRGILRKRHTNSFRPTHETQARVERKRRKGTQ